MYESNLSSLAYTSIQKTLEAQAEALQVLANQYGKQSHLQESLKISLDILFQSVLMRGKLVLCGIGKSHKIAAKMVATLNSLSIQSSLLHPSEALHGDLGMVREGDAIIFVTASGNTPELINLLPHINPNIPIVLLTCAKISKLSQHPQVRSLLLAEIPTHLKEDSVHGLPAPTITTTMSLALADAVSLALSEMVEEDLEKRRVKFSMHHPGGAIGQSLSHLNVNQMAIAGHPTTMSSSSSSSLFSLSQLRTDLNGTSVSSQSDDETAGIHAKSHQQDQQDQQDQRLNVEFNSHNDSLSTDIGKLQNSSSDAVVSVSEQALETVSEPEVLLWLGKADSIVIQINDDKSITLSTDYVRKLYRKTNDFTNFKKILCSVNA